MLWVWISLTHFSHLLLARNDTIRLSEFGMSRWAESSQCHFTPSVTQTLNIRWTSPETLSDHKFTKQADVW